MCERLRKKYGRDKFNSANDGYPAEFSTNEKKRLTSFLKAIKAIFLLQIMFGIMIPLFDTFLDLGDGFHNLINRLYAQRTSVLRFHPANVICIPGAGFSGFWYSFGRLNALEDQNRQSHLAGAVHDSTLTTDMKESYFNGKAINQDSIASKQYNISDHNLEYECFSAGCLVAVASVLNVKVDNVLNLAVETQISWHQGRISRYDVVEHFIDGLLKSGVDRIITGHDSSRHHDNFGLEQKKAFSRIHIVTTDLQNGLLKYNSRTPTDMKELKELLLQTTWM